MMKTLLSILQDRDSFLQEISAGVGLQKKLIDLSLISANCFAVYGVIIGSQHSFYAGDLIGGEAAGFVHADLRHLPANTVYLQCVLRIKANDSADSGASCHWNVNHQCRIAWFRTGDLFLHRHNSKLSVLQVTECCLLYSIRIAGRHFLQSHVRPDVGRGRPDCGITANIFAIVAAVVRVRRYSAGLDSETLLRISRSAV